MIYTCDKCNKQFKRLDFYEKHVKECTVEETTPIEDKPVETVQAPVEYTAPEAAVIPEECEIVTTTTESCAVDTIVNTPTVAPVETVYVPVTNCPYCGKIIDRGTEFMHKRMCYLNPMNNPQD